MSKEQALKIQQGNVEERVERKPRREVVPEVLDELGVISENTKILGNIITKGHIGIAGVVQGNIEAKGNVIIKGVVKGDIVCQNLMIEKGKVLSNIVCDGKAIIKEGAVLTGNIKCKELSIGGTVNGTIECSGQTGILYSAVVNADIKTKKLGVEPSAKLCGRIQTA